MKARRGEAKVMCSRIFSREVESDWACRTMVHYYYYCLEELCSEGLQPRISGSRENYGNRKVSSRIFLDITSIASTSIELTHQHQPQTPLAIFDHRSGRLSYLGGIISSSSQARRLEECKEQWSIVDDGKTWLSSWSNYSISARICGSKNDRSPPELHS